MRWIGACAGAFLGSARGGGILGGIVGAVVGNWVEEKVRSAMGRKYGGKPETPVECGSAYDPYSILGCSRDASDEEVSAAYREKARRLHPDALRAQGLPDEIVAEANDRMARVNAAWSAIRQQRHL